MIVTPKGAPFDKLRDRSFSEIFIVPASLICK